MPRKVIFALVFAAALGGAAWWAIFLRRSVPPIAPPAPELSSDLYPLYAADWGASARETVTVGTSSYDGAGITSASIDAGMDPGNVLTPFAKYYDRKLKAAGWQVANDLAAGGHMGGQTGYRKEGRVILVGFRIDYQNVPENAPSECPCSVTLSLFSD